MPFRLDLTAWALRRRLNNIVDRWVDESWRRVLVINGTPVEILATQMFDKGNIFLKVSLAGLHLDSQIENARAQNSAAALALHLAGKTYRTRKAAKNNVIKMSAFNS